MGQILDRELELLSELESYENLLGNLLASVENIYADYQGKKMTYADYRSRVKTLLKGKTKKYWIEHYNSYMRDLLKELKLLNAQIFKQYYDMEIIETEPSSKLDDAPGFHAVMDSPDGFRDQKKVEVKDVSRMSLSKIPEPESPKAKAPVTTGTVKVKTSKKVSITKSKGKAIKVTKKSDLPKFMIEEDDDGVYTPATKVHRKVASKASPKVDTKVATKTDIDEPKVVEPESPKHYVRPKGKKGKIENLEKYTMLGEEENKHVKEKEEPLSAKTLGAVLFKHLWELKYIQYLLKKFFSTKKEVKKQSELEKLIKSRMASPELNVSKYLSDKENLISKEASYMRSELDLTHLHAFKKPMIYARLSNFLLRRFTSLLLRKFPGFFRGLYDSFRLSNIPVLSNTYINVMIFTTLVAFFITFPLIVLIYAFQDGSFLLGILKSLGISFVLTMGVFFYFYLYPGMRVKSRAMNVNTNLPFAINHIAAVANSGVPPTEIFKLVASSEGYGEVSTELKKIVEFVEIFGYDVLTSIKTVSSSSPSKKFKNFLEGIISSVESGGDLSRYLEQKADESMLSYELERQKYMEAITTASDIYTGIMLAAPLFFIIALSIVSVIGGQLGGVDVNVLIIFATYVLMPIANLFFMMFLQVTRQEA